jgi:hypothetical protein
MAHAAGRRRIATVIVDEARGTRRFDAIGERAGAADG